MKEVISILFGGAFTAGVSIALGSLFLRALGLRLFRVEATLFAFLAGSGLLSLFVTLLCFAELARKGVFLGLGSAAIAAAVWVAVRHRVVRRTLPAVPLNWLVPLFLILVAYFIYYLVNTVAPEISPDGSGYHLGNVARIWRHHGFDWEYRSMYAYLSQGVEMLFLFAFSFGRHSAAALVHFMFLCSLPLLILCYGRRFGIPKAAVFGALAVFASAVIGKDGTSAYNDLTVATLIYAVFYLLQVWSQEQDDKLLIFCGLLIGFGFAAKYTAAIAAPFALAWIWRFGGLRLRRIVLLAVPAAVLAVPWLARNWVWVGNPMAPFANALFPNPYYHTGMERIYVELLKHYGGLKHWWQIPLELTLRGGIVGGTLNPVFLMAPLSLLALRSSQGRRLLLAGLVFAVPAWWNIGTRFLIPSAPFLAVAMGLALESIPVALPTLFAFVALTGWPPVVSAYCDGWNWRIARFPLKEAFREESVDAYILKELPEYGIKAPVESHVPQGEKVFSFAGRPAAYIERDIVVGYESSLGNLVQDIMLAPQEYRPVLRQSYRFLPVEAKAVRIANNATSDDFWSVAEMRVLLDGKEIPRASDWRVSAWPNAWEAPLAFDNNYATRWSTWERLRPHAHLQIDFPKPLRISEVALQCDPAWKAKLEVDVLLPMGRWVAITDTPEYAKVETPGGIRLAAARQVKALGFRYLLVNEGDHVYQDLDKYLAYWGMTELARVNDIHFYRID